MVDQDQPCVSVAHPVMSRLTTLPIARHGATAWSIGGAPALCPRHGKSVRIGAADRALASVVAERLWRTKSARNVVRASTNGWPAQGVGARSYNVPQFPRPMEASSRPRDAPHRHLPRGRDRGNLRASRRSGVQDRAHLRFRECQDRCLRAKAKAVSGTVRMGWLKPAAARLGAARGMRVGRGAMCV